MKNSPKGRCALALAVGLSLPYGRGLQAQDLDQAFGAAAEAAGRAGHRLGERRAAAAEAAVFVPADPGPDGASFTAGPNDVCGPDHAPCRAGARVRCEMDSDHGVRRSISAGEREMGSLFNVLGERVFIVWANSHRSLNVAVNCRTRQSANNPANHYCEVDRVVNEPGSLRVTAVSGGGQYCDDGDGFYRAACGESEHRLFREGNGSESVHWRYEHHKSAVISWGLRGASVGFSYGPFQITPNLQGSETYTQDWVVEDYCRLVQVRAGGPAT